MSDDEWFKFEPDYGEAIYVRSHPGQWHAEKNLPFVRGDERVPFDFAYCITAHKSQGDEWNRVVVIEQPSTLWEQSRWSYTAASRAKEHLVWLSC